MLGVVALSFSSCKKWLQVDPEDRFTEQQIFSAPTGFEDAINGIYLQMNNSNMYGQKLTMSTVEMLANRFYTSSSSSNTLTRLSKWEYGESTVKSHITPIWMRTYVAIGNINHLLYALDKYKGNISEQRWNTIRGEALGLRAFLHFDLLRLFGPAYNISTAEEPTIPYYTSLSPNIGDFLSSNQIIDKLLVDINESITRLEADNSTENGSGGNRNLKFNEVAALALKARILQWKGDNPGAYDVATLGISKAENFSWVAQTKVSDVENPDRIFLSEVLFGLYNSALYDTYNKVYYYELDSDNLLGSGSTTYLESIFEGNTTDYRYTYSWKVPPMGQTNPTFFKYADIVQKNRPDLNPQRFVIPLMRKSELYYIAAECADDDDEALGYLNQVRNRRGISSLATATNLSNEIMKEYRKEFFGEGQLWYYYKRHQITQIISPAASTLVTVPNVAWQVPVPDDEFSAR